MLTQIVYDAYGRVIGRDDPATPSTGPPELRVGHKGLFFDRLDAGIFDVTLGRETPRLAPGARLSGYARNRTLHADLGRWNQPDPNATGLPVQGFIGYHGDATDVAVQPFDLATHFGDGPNVREYLGGMAWNAQDPTGLFFSLADLSLGSLTLTELQTDWSQDTLDYGMSFSDSLYTQLADIGNEQWMAVEMAGDWSVSDDYFDVNMTAGGGGQLGFGGGSSQGGSQTTAGHGHIIAGSEVDHLVPRFAGGLNDANNLYRLMFKDHRGSGGKSRHANLNALFRLYGIPLTSRAMDSRKWQDFMRNKASKDPSFVRNFNRALLENAKHVDKASPGYFAAMQKALHGTRLSWMPRGTRLRGR